MIAGGLVFGLGLAACSSRTGEEESYADNETSMAQEASDVGRSPASLPTRVDSASALMRAPQPNANRNAGRPSSVDEGGRLARPPSSLDSQGGTHMTTAQIDGRPGTPYAPAPTTPPGTAPQPGASPLPGAGTPPSIPPPVNAEQPVAAGCPNMSLQVGGRVYTFDQILFGLQARLGDYVAPGAFRMNYSADPAVMASVLNRALSENGPYYDYALRHTDAYGRVVKFVNRQWNQADYLPGEQPSDTGLRDGKLAWLVTLMAASAKNSECMRHIHSKAPAILARADGAADPRVDMFNALLVPFQQAAEVLRTGGVAGLQAEFKTLEADRVARNGQRDQLHRDMSDARVASLEDRKALVEEFNLEAEILVTRLSGVQGCDGSRSSSSLSDVSTRVSSLERVRQARLERESRDSGRRAAAVEEKAIRPKLSYEALTARVTRCKSQIEREIAKLDALNRKYATQRELQLARAQAGTSAGRRTPVDTEDYEKKMKETSAQIAALKGYKTKVLEKVGKGSISAQLEALKVIHGTLEKDAGAKELSDLQVKLDQLDDLDDASADKLITYRALGGGEGPATTPSAKQRRRARY